MTASLEFLPEHKRKELEEITKCIVYMMEPEMVLLFGSYARNNWVEEQYMEEGIRYEYKSDFDILVISKVNLGPRRINVWRRLEAEIRLMRTQTPVSMIHHGIKEVNAEIRKNSYFFTDIRKEGVVLYDSGNFQLADPLNLNNRQRMLNARDDYKHWFESANIFLKTFEFNLSENDLNVAAFQLHQATERYFTALLLVFTGYRTKTHDLDKLRTMAVNIHEKFKTVFPFTNPVEKNRFDLLRRAYIDARYKKEYTITQEELEYLSRRVAVLKALVQETCEVKLID